MPIRLVISATWPCKVEGNWRYLTSASAITRDMSPSDEGQGGEASTCQNGVYRERKGFGCRGVAVMGKELRRDEAA